MASKNLTKMLLVIALRYITMTKTQILMMIDHDDNNDDDGNEDDGEDNYYNDDEYEYYDDEGDSGYVTEIEAANKNTNIGAEVCNDDDDDGYNGVDDKIDDTRKGEGGEFVSILVLLQIPLLILIVLVTTSVVIVVITALVLVVMIPTNESPLIMLFIMKDGWMHLNTRK